MKKGDWYRYLFARVKYSIDQQFFFEAAFICYGIIDDRLTSMITTFGMDTNRKMIKRKITDLSKINDKRLEAAFGFRNWDSSLVRYKNIGLLGNVLAWCELYRNPMQHLLGDPRGYKSEVGDFHTQITSQMAREGETVTRSLAAAVMRFKKL